MPKNPVTIVDIAREAGVSAQTVSRVVNNKKDVSPSTRQRIQSIIDRMGYSPNRVAQGLRVSQSRMMGIVTLNADHPVPIRAMEKEASLLEYTLAFYSSKANDPDDIAKTFGMIQAQMMDGLIVITPHTFITYDMILEYTHDTPVVMYNSHPDASVPSVAYNQTHGIHTAVAHLIELGHRDICMVSGTIDTRIDAKIRQEAFITAMCQHGIDNPLSIVGDFDAKGGYTTVDTLLEQNQPFTALVCVNDMSALGAMKRLQEAGLRVPDDVSVIGFDDNDFSAYLHTPLTTIRQDFRELGRLAIAYLGELIEDENTVHEQRVLMPELIVRESTAPPRTRR